MASEFLEVKMKPIHFFKIMCDENLHQGTLMIPRNFVEKYGKCLPKAIWLKTPNGAKWKLYLIKNDGKFWFEKGWKEFVEHHSLSHGHLLLFRYEKNYHFEVQIYDESALEINYPLTRYREVKRVLNGEENKALNNEVCRTNQKRKAYSSFEIGSTSGVKVGKYSQMLDVDHTHNKWKGKQVISAVERAKCLKTCNPSFVVVMCASYVEYNCYMSIPSEFGRRHIGLDKKRGEIYLQNLNETRVWHARYQIRMYLNRLKFELTSGWKEFAKDNKLKVGDACNFELISSNMTFQVHIFRDANNDNTNCSTSQKSSQMRGEEG